MLSESEPETHIVEKKKKQSRKAKMAAHTHEIAGPSTHVTPAPPLRPTTQASAATAPREANELSEMRSMFNEMKNLTEKNAAYVEMLAKAEQARQEAETSQPPVLQPIMEGEVTYDDQPNIEDVSHEQIVETDYSQYPDSEHVFTDLHDYGWETDEDTPTSQAPLTLLQKIMSKPIPAVTGGPSLAVTPAPAVAAAGGGAVGGVADPTVRQVFTLSDDLREGTLQNELQELYKKIKKPVKQRIDLDESLAGAISHFYAYTKTKKAINEIARQYTGIKTIPEARVQALNDEIKFIEGRKLAEDGMMWATKGVVAALTAIAPTLALILSRGKGDRELDEQAKPMLDAIKVLVFSHSQLTTDRLANVNKVVNTPLGKDVVKKKTDKYGEKELPTEHLLGEDLGDRNKKVLKSARASDTVMNTSLAPKKWRKSADFYRPTFTTRRTRGYRGGRGGFSRGAPYSTVNRTGFQTGRYNKSSDYSTVSNYQPAQRGARGRGSTQYRGFQK